MARTKHIFHKKYQSFTSNLNGSNLLVDLTFKLSDVRMIQNHPATPVSNSKNLAIPPSPLLPIGNVHKWCPILGGEGGSKMTPKNRTVEGKNRTLGGRGGQKSSKIVGHHLCTFPYINPICPSLFIKSIFLNFHFCSESLLYLFSTLWFILHE